MISTLAARQMQLSLNTVDVINFGSLLARGKLLCNQ